MDQDGKLKLHQQYHQIYLGQDFLKNVAFVDFQTEKFPWYFQTEKGPMCLHLPNLFLVDQYQFFDVFSPNHVI